MIDTYIYINIIYTYRYIYIYTHFKDYPYRLCSRYIGTVCMSIFQFKYYSCWGMVVDINVGVSVLLFPLRTGLLIGSQGAKIKELRRDSGCKAC